MGWNVRRYLNSYNPAEAESSLAMRTELELEKYKFLESQAVSVEPVYRRHICIFCKKIYPLKNLLKRHMQFGCKMNPKTAQFACSFCPYKSMYKANMERHIRNVHDAGAMKFRCDLCNFRSNYTFCVRRHMRSFHNAPSDEKQ